MDCSESDKPERKRKSCDSECPIPQKVKVIEPNPQFGVGNNTEAAHQERSKKASNIFRPWEDMNQGIENEQNNRNTNQFGAGNKADPSHQVEPEKEKNQQPENGEVLEPEQSHQPEAAKQHEVKMRWGVREE